MSEINSVNVFSVDEERLKFRAIIAPNIVAPAAGGTEIHQGEFNFILPPPTNFANNSQYSQAVVKLDTLIAAPAGDIADPVWCNRLGNTKLGAVVVRLDIGSSQTTTIQLNSGNEVAEGGATQIGGFRQLIPLQIVNVGTSGAGAAAVGPLFTNEGACWTGIGSGISATDPILCANPFGQKVRMTLINPLTNAPVWLRSAGGATNTNIGRYAFQFTITMIPNNRSEGSS